MTLAPLPSGQTRNGDTRPSTGGRLLKVLADALLPALCLACRTSVDRHGELCASCWSAVDFIEPPICDRLGIPLPYGTGETIVSAAALADPPDYDRARAAARYDGAMRDLVHDLKFRDRHEGLKLFGRWLVHAGSDILGEAECVVAVPLHRLRLWSRRYNQSALLAQEVAAHTGLACDPFLLQRSRATPRQVGLTRDQRSRNVAGAFTVPETRRGDVEGRRLVLIDDVLTTGATVNACAKALRRAGARHVDVLVLARAAEHRTTAA